MFKRVQHNLLPIPNEFCPKTSFIRLENICLYTNSQVLKCQIIILSPSDVFFLFQRKIKYLFDCFLTFSFKENHYFFILVFYFKIRKLLIFCFVFDIENIFFQFVLMFSAYLIFFSGAQNTYAKLNKSMH